MTTRKSINYLNRDFDSLKSDLLEYVKLTYPDRYNDFSEASIGMMLLELNAFVGDVNSYHVDKKFNEMFLKTAQQRESVFRLAENLGYQVKGNRSSVTLVDIDLNVPTDGNTYDSDYAVTIRGGMRLASDGGQIFEIPEDVNFDSHLSMSGVKDREIIPVRDTDGNIIEYTLRKRVVAIAGESVVASLQVTSTNSKPYMQWTIDDVNVVAIRDIVENSSATPPALESDWVANRDNIWYQVSHLADDKIYIDTTTGQTSASTRIGYWVNVDKRFISRYNSDGTLVTTFGSGVPNSDLINDYLVNGISSLELTQVLEGASMGLIPTPGIYLHMRYRKGGGLESNVPAGSITKITSYEVSYVPGGGAISAGELSSTLTSLVVTNAIPAIGGADPETTEEIKHRASHHFSAQDRVVTVDDYTNRSYQMPGQYGTVYRAYSENDITNSITRLYVISRDEEKKLKNTGNTALKENLAAYLEEYRLMNDILELRDGLILNLGVEFTVLMDKAYSKKEVLFNCITALKDYFNTDNWNMNQPIYIAQVVELLRDVAGVVNVADLTFKNLYGTGYSDNTVPARIQDIDTFSNTEVAIIPVNNSIPGFPTAMWEIKYPEYDIVGRAI